MKLNVVWVGLIVASTISGFYEMSSWFIFAQSVFISIFCDNFLPYNLLINFNAFNRKEKVQFVRIEKIED